MNCRSCASSKMHSFLDLGFAPPSNAYLSANDLSHSETHFPLRVAVCEECWLVQAEQYTDVGDLFDADYAYFSSTSQSWLEHANRYASKMIAGLGLGKSSFVVELASNDGYLLRNFVEREVPCLGVEPTLSTATAARTIGVSTLQEFFGVATAQKILDSHGPADLICGNNVYAHVPDIHGFTRGVQRLLKPEGIVTFEFPHLLNLLQYNQFDTVYHEHFSYFSLLAVLPIFKNAKLRVFKVEKLSTHGGSLRIYGCHQGSTRESDPSLSEALAEERQYGLDTLAAYAGVQSRADALKDSFLYWLIEQKRKGLTVGAYGAAAKGNTLLNFAGVRSDLINFVCDAAPSKQGKFLPGSHVPILSPEALRIKKPDYVVIFPWNIATEIVRSNDLSSWGGKWVIALPELRVLP